MRKGNKTRFANHNSKAPNCFAKILLVTLSLLLLLLFFLSLSLTHTLSRSLTHTLTLALSVPHAVSRVSSVFLFLLNTHKHTYAHTHARHSHTRAHTRTSTLQVTNSLSLDILVARSCFLRRMLLALGGIYMYANASHHDMYANASHHVCHTVMCELKSIACLSTRSFKSLLPLSFFYTPVTRSGETTASEYSRKDVPRQETSCSMIITTRITTWCRNGIKTSNRSSLSSFRSNSRCILSKDPYTRSKEPYTRSKEPYAHSNEPFMHDVASSRWSLPVVSKFEDMNIRIKST